MGIQVQVRNTATSKKKMPKGISLGSLTVNIRRNPKPANAKITTGNDHGRYNGVPRRPLWIARAFLASWPGRQGNLIFRL